MPIPSRFGMYLDVAGRVTEESSRFEYLTVAGIAILPELREEVRQSIGPDRPKWRNSTYDDVICVATLVRNIAVAALAIRMRKAEPGWSKLWQDARDYQREVAQSTRGQGSFLRAANVVKFFLFGECQARLAAECVKQLGKPTITDDRGRSIVDVDVTCDTDIQGEENVEFFKGLWEAMGDDQPLLSRLGLVFHTRSIELMTEQSEPLLILPDHIAGAIHTTSRPRSVNPPRGIAAEDLNEIEELYRGLDCLVCLEEILDVPYRKMFGGTVLGRNLWPEPEE